MTHPDLIAIRRASDEQKRRHAAAKEARRLCELLVRARLTRSDRDLIAEGVKG